MIRLLGGLFFAGIVNAALAQTNPGQLPAWGVAGNPTGSPSSALAGATLSAIMDGAFGGSCTDGTIALRAGGTWRCSVNAAPLPPVDLSTTIPVNGFYASGSGAIVHFCPLTYPQSSCLSGMADQYAAVYLKATATQNNTIAEYMSVTDCNLNSGKTGPTPGVLNDNKVCVYNSVVTGSNAGTSTWVQANNIILDAADTGTYKVNTEMDITNSGADCAVGSRNCYGLIIGANGNPITAFISLTTPQSTSASHIGILLNGTHVAEFVGVENSSAANTGFCNGCLVPQTLARAGFEDHSTTSIGMLMLGTYNDAAIQVPSGAKICFEATNVACLAWQSNPSNTVIVSGQPIAASFMQFTQQNVIGMLPACTAARIGFRSNITNGIANPMLGAPIGTTGTTWQPVACNGSSWVYG
jgi:hypothetical protein